MKRINPTQELPPNYHQIDQLDLRDNPGLAMIINLIGVGLLFGVAWLLVRSLSFLRPDYLSSENILVITGMREFWRGVLLLVLSLGLMILLSEGLRWLFLGHDRSATAFGFQWVLHLHQCTRVLYLTQCLSAHSTGAAGSDHSVWPGGGSHCSAQPGSRRAAADLAQYRGCCE